MADRPRSRFRATTPQVSAPKDPEALWYSLSSERQHESLRGPQQDVLRSFIADASDEADVALELPTGTGKTAVGLLIAEWRRRVSGRPVTYLTLTKQLAHQVIDEAGRLGIKVADITGSARERDREAETRYKAASAVGVASYASLFNSGPVVVASDVIIFDDVHGGEQQVAGMWTVTVNRTNERLYTVVLNAVARSLTGAQLRSLGPRDSKSVHLANVWAHPECTPELNAALEDSDDAAVRYAWPLIREHLHACLFLVSREAISIRPLIPPTSTFSPFAESRQRLYLSATLGGAADLQRMYGVGRITTIRAEQAQSGRHFIFVPGAYMDDDDAHRVVARVWDEMQPRRALLLAPSERAASATFDSLSVAAKKKPTRLSAREVSDSLEPFTNSNNVLLTMPGRYDGIDLPQEDCRLLIMAGSPASISDLEHHLSENWKLGPVLRGRERTRLIQGLGRCTRGDTDYSVVFWLRQSLVDRSLSPAFLEALPADVRAELIWGRTQSEGATDTAEFVELVLDLLNDQATRAEASRLVRDDAGRMDPPALAGSSQLTAVVKDELKYSSALWDGYFSRAIQAGQAVADSVTDPILAGYRGWWWFLTAIASFQSGDTSGARDAMTRALSCGVNTGFIADTLRSLPTETAVQAHDTDGADFEGIWDFLDDLGWAGPSFDKASMSMLESIGQDDPTRFHMGVEALGRMLGAHAVRRTEHGVPDVVWCFPSGGALTFEAKTEKGGNSTLSKGDILEANGHVDWVHANLNVARDDIIPAVVAYTNQVHDAGEAHIRDLRYVHPNDLRDLAAVVAKALSEVRPLYRNHDYSDIAAGFCADLRVRGVTPADIRKSLSSVFLKT